MGFPAGSVGWSGDIISIDVGASYRGWVGDSAWTYAVGDVDEESLRLLEATEGRCGPALRQTRGGNHLPTFAGRSTSRWATRLLRGARVHGTWRGPADARGAAGAELSCLAERGGGSGPAAGIASPSSRWCSVGTWLTTHPAR